MRRSRSDEHRYGARRFTGRSARTGRTAPRARAGGGGGAHEEPHGDALGPRLNWLRAAVLGANGGIVSTAGIVVGVAGATPARGALLTAGLAGLLAGSMPMAAGEYVSVSTQRGSERAALATERRGLREQPEEELAELAGLLRECGLLDEVAARAARELTRREALRAPASEEPGIGPDALTNPWHAAGASFLSFTAGALLPLLPFALPPQPWRLAVTVLSVLAALALTGWGSARLGAAPSAGRCCATWAAARSRWPSPTPRARCSAPWASAEGPRRPRPPAAAGWGGAARRAPGTRVP
ncbi:hypothetical protein GCM10023082_40320 [Streptomyces tremellae]|uniref:VIT family protein n=1 Tax=Streptomyces tremellae TaxID=1124239 RepID=A0ABP7FGB1_9ACTN